MWKFEKDVITRQRVPEKRGGNTEGTTRDLSWDVRGGVERQKMVGGASTTSMFVIGKIRQIGWFRLWRML